MWHLNRKLLSLKDNYQETINDEVDGLKFFKNKGINCQLKE